MTFNKSVYLGLGSNLSDPHKQIQTAVNILAEHPRIQLNAQAPCYQTPAWGVTDQPDFINTAVAITTSLSPNDLLKTVKDIEYKQMGRVKNQRWHERLIDIDILLYGLEHLEHESLTIPHPLIIERWFVILPLLALNPCLPVKLAIQILNKLSQETPPKDITKRS